MRRIGTAIGHHVASPIVESMDVNTILNEVDWNEVLQQVDIDALFDKIDVNKVLDRIDINRHLDRVDMDRHLSTVDYDALIRRSNLEEIIARSTSGVLSGFTNLFRTRMAWIDQWGQRIGRCSCRREKDYLPPRPGRPEDSKTVWKHSGELDKLEFGRAIQFRTSGATNRLVYLALDQFFVWATYAILVALVHKLGEAFTDNPEWLLAVPVTKKWWFDFVVYLSYNAMYWISQVGCFGRTVGMWILGLLLVSKSGNRVSFLQVCFQIILVPLNILFFGWVVGYMRRDGKFLSDIVGGVAIVYAWDARNVHENNAEMAMSLTDFVDTLPEQKRSSFLLGGVNDDDDDDDDEDENDEDEYYSIGGGDIELADVEKGETR